ncbi:hypothetical protein CBI55_21425 [Pseudomonas syringae]|nr:hypothetical protein CBI55_21425 [Pseudomonas syringae]
MNKQQLQRYFSLARVYFFAIACAAFHTVWILLIVNYIFDLSALMARSFMVICFIGISFFLVRMFHRKINSF